MCASKHGGFIASIKGPVIGRFRCTSYNLFLTYVFQYPPPPPSPPPPPPPCNDTCCSEFLLGGSSNHHPFFSRRCISDMRTSKRGLWFMRVGKKRSPPHHYLHDHFLLPAAIACVIACRRASSFTFTSTSSSLAFFMNISIGVTCGYECQLCSEFARCLFLLGCRCTTTTTLFPSGL